MSQCQITSVTCPQCGNSQEFTIWGSLNITLDPEEKPRLLSGQLHQLTCCNCGTRTEVDYPFLYHDMNNMLMVYHLPADSIPERATVGDLVALTGPTPKGYTLRFVHSLNDLKEKVNIADAGLDDRVIEFFKSVICSSKPELNEGKLLFLRIANSPDGEERIVFNWLKGGRPREVYVPLSSYRNYEEAFAPMMAFDINRNNSWKRVDIAYAAELLAAYRESGAS